MTIFSRFAPRFVLFLSAATLSLTGCEGLSSAGKSLSDMKWPSLPSLSSSNTSSAKTGPAASAAPTLPPIMAVTGPECPQVKILGDVSRISQFTDPTKPSPATLSTETNLSNIAAACKIGANSVTLDLTLDFAGKLGPAGKKAALLEANYTYPYFLSVVDASGQIISKDVFAISITYAKGQDSVVKQDMLRQTIPLSPGAKANQYQVIAGFQLSDDELAYNRSSGLSK